MDELEYYSLEEIEGMELPDWEISERSDADLLAELETIRAMNGIEPNPHLDSDEKAARAEYERRGLLMDDDWECEERRERNSFDCGWRQGCGVRKGMPF